MTVADTSEDALRGFLTGNDPEAASVPAWKLECLDAVSGRLDDRDDVPAELLTIMQADCRARFERLLSEHPTLMMRDLERPATAIQALEIATVLKANATMDEAEALRSDLAKARGLVSDFAEICEAIEAVQNEAESQGLRLRARQPRLCDSGRAERLISQGEDTLVALDDPDGTARFGIRPGERLVEAISEAQNVLDNARSELTAALAEAEAQNAELVLRLDNAKAEGQRLASELPDLHEELNAACEAYGSMVSGMQPWGCVGRAQGRHRQWLEENLAVVQGLTLEDVQQSTGALSRAENYFATIRTEIGEAMTELDAAREAQQ